MSEESARKARRSYRPEVEGLEALRLFSGLIAELPVPVADQGASAFVEPIEPTQLTVLIDELALDLTDVRVESSQQIDSADPNAVQSGLSQLDRYLASTWNRAGVPPHKRDDCTQAVYLSLLEQLSRPGFEQLVAAVGVFGIREVFTRERFEGLAFFRAIDATKKRARRERHLPPLDEGSTGPPAPEPDHDRIEALYEAMDRVLSPREADLIQATIAGESPGEIAERWNVASKTISNEKTRALNKLRNFLVDDREPTLMTF